MTDEEFYALPVGYRFACPEVEYMCEIAEHIGTARRVRILNERREDMIFAPGEVEEGQDVIASFWHLEDLEPEDLKPALKPSVVRRK